MPPTRARALLLLLLLALAIFVVVYMVRDGALAIAVNKDYYF